MSAALRCISNELQADDDKTQYAGHTDWALVIAAAFEGRFVLDGSALYFAEDSNMWSKMCDKSLHGLVRDYLHTK